MTGRRWLLLVGCLLAACAPAKRASDPAEAKNDTAASKEADFKKDAVEAMAVLASRWALLGTKADAKEQPTGWHRHAGSGTCMPKGSASWELAKEHTYGPDDESVTMWNEKLKSQLTLYTYPAAQALDAEFDAVLGEMSRSCTEGPVLSAKTGDTHVGGCARRLEGDVLLLEQVVLFQRGKWLHKARITFAAAQADAAYSPTMSVVSQSFEACPAGG